MITAAAATAQDTGCAHGTPAYLCSQEVGLIAREHWIAADSAAQAASQEALEAACGLDLRYSSTVISSISSADDGQDVTAANRCCDNRAELEGFRLLPKRSAPDNVWC
jgi:hypothetical protein